MINKYLNQFKIDKIKQIVNNYQYIYIFRYNDLNYNEFILLKKNNKNLKFLILKQNLIKYINIQLKGQGSLIMFYTNEIIDLKKIQKFKKLDLICLFNKHLIFSNLKINQLFFKNNNPLNLQLKKPLYYLINNLKRI